MTTDDRPESGNLAPKAWWRQTAGHVLAHLAEQGAAPRDALVLLPAPQWLPIARRAFAEAAGTAVSWLPRLHTPQTWAAACGPAPRLAAEAFSGHAGRDLLAARALVQRPRADGAAAPDEAAADAAPARLLAAVPWWRERMRERPPAARAPLVEVAWRRMAVAEGTGAWDQWLQRLALEWAAIDPRFDTDRLWLDTPPATSVLLPVGDDAFLDRWLDHARAQGASPLEIRAQPRGADPFERIPYSQATRLLAHDAEDEAMAAAAAVIEALQAGRQPVALVAEDRELIRRVAALLARQGVAVADETGWTLATTRAAAWLQSPILAAMAPEDRDALLDAIKHGAESDADGDARALERHWRQAVAGRPRPMPDGARRLLEAAHRRLAPLRMPGLQALQTWRDRLRDVLGTDEAAQAWRQDPAGQAAWAALGLDAGASPDSAGVRLDLAGFAAWVRAVLEAVRWVPPATESPQVLLVPLREAAMREFGAVVLPGADHRRLGGSGVPAPALPGTALRRELGLPDRDADARERAAAFVALLRQPNLTLLRRASEDGEQLQTSPWVIRWLAAMRRAGHAAPAEREVAVHSVEVDDAPLQPPAPAQIEPLPQRLSVSTLGLLRECPYRFHARQRLGLAAQPELTQAAGSREMGEWLHLLLQRWHEARPGPRAFDDDVRSMLELAQTLPDAQDSATDDLWPQRAMLEDFARRYVRWQQARDRDGWRVLACESPRRIRPETLAEVELHGTIDRIDERAGAQGRTERQLLDYKTGRINPLKAAVKQPMEDTQLALYAAFERAQPQGGLAADAISAAYVSLADAPSIETAEHPSVAATAEALLPALANELQRIAAGAPLPALGSEPTCGWCEYRGLCRRDDWANDTDRDDAPVDDA